MTLKSTLVRADTVRVSAARKNGMPQQIVSFLLAFFIGSTPASSVQGTTPATLARLEVRISTTSPWTQVTLQPGRVVAARTQTIPADVELTELSNGWVVRSSTRSLRTVVVSAVFEEPTRAPSIRVVVRKGHSGSATVDVVNRSAAPFVAARLANKLPRSTNGIVGSDGLTAVLKRSRRQLFGSADPVLARPDPRRLVLAAYYPWFAGGTYENPQFTDRPSDKRSTAKYADVLAMTQQARGAGIDGFVVSWQGEAFSGRSFDLALSAARETGGVVVPYLEMLQAHEAGDSSGRADPLVVLEWLSDTLDRADDRAFLRSGGVPVVFVWQMGRLSRIGWVNVLKNLAARGKKVRIVGDASSAYGMIQWGVHDYDPNPLAPDALALHNRERMLDAKVLGSTDATGPHLYVATVSPGFDDSKLPERTPRVTPRGAGGARYLASWDAALSARPDWVLITSWNEWFEGTSIEPSLAYGDLALRQTAEQIARFVG